MFFLLNTCALIYKNVWNSMVRLILVGIIIVLVYSQPDLRLTVADWLRNASNVLAESVRVNWLN